MLGSGRSYRLGSSQSWSIKNRNSLVGTMTRALASFKLRRFRGGKGVDWFRRERGSWITIKTDRIQTLYTSSTTLPLPTCNISSHCLLSGVSGCSIRFGYLVFSQILGIWGLFRVLFCSLMRENTVASRAADVRRVVYMQICIRALKLAIPLSTALSQDLKNASPQLP